MCNDFPYNTNYTREFIDGIVERIRECIIVGRCQISMNENREENNSFVNNYRITFDRQMSLISQIDATDFCHSLQNTKPGYQHETLYVFVPQVELRDSDDIKHVVDVYTKFNIIQSPKGDYTIVYRFMKEISL